MMIMVALQLKTILTSNACMVNAPNCCKLAELKQANVFPNSADHFRFTHLLEQIKEIQKSTQRRETIFKNRGILNFNMMHKLTIDVNVKFSTPCY
ncbi:hypothetical protein T01_4641 [Trichinella spiralis]|uniref:Uncharacterized protein n=1 Tax=Trichinella spiralis TaxID=6334 RepID=A0A0V1BSJ0_TRISP|nr:hypothetical protein T01_4641 [Trichinella spiralis]